MACEDICHFPGLPCFLEVGERAEPRIPGRDKHRDRTLGSSACPAADRCVAWTKSLSVSGPLRPSRSRAADQNLACV